jgi:hypothetical protein
MLPFPASKTDTCNNPFAAAVSFPPLVAMLEVTLLLLAGSFYPTKKDRMLCPCFVFLAWFF